MASRHLHCILSRFRGSGPRVAMEAPDCKSSSQRMADSQKVPI